MVEIIKKNKKILLIAPLFFDYYKEIIKEAEGIGLKVDYVCDAPSDTNLSKAIGRLNKSFIKYPTKRYFNKEVLPIVINAKYDYVVLIAGMTFAFTREMIAVIKKIQPQAKFIMYQWDSEKNLPFSTQIHYLFDKRFTFDRLDYERSEKYDFLPLFYTKIYESIGERENEKFDYDCSYIGTAHPKKFKDINNMSLKLINKLPRQFIYHYMPSKIKYYYHKVTAVEYKTANIESFKFTKISNIKMIDIIEKSKCILDSPQNGQIGLTMRTIECIGAKKKLITTNSDIKNYDFYCESNVLIFDKNFDENSSFFSQPYKNLSAEIYQKYSLKSWLINLLELSEDEK